MPTINEGISHLGSSIASGIDRRNAMIADKEEKDRRRNAARAAYLAMQRGVPSVIANAGAESGKQADEIVAEYEAGSRDALMAPQREALDLNLANRSIEDPNAARMNLNMPGPPKMPGAPIGQSKPGLNVPSFGPVRPGGMPTTVPGGTELPDPGMRSMLSEVATNFRGMMPGGRRDVALAKMHPGEEGYAGNASRAIEGWKSQKMIADAAAKKNFIAEYDPDKLYDVPSLVNIGFGEETAIKYAGQGPIPGRELARRMYEGQPEKASKPTWLQNIYHQEAIRQGLEPGTEPYFNFVTKADKVDPEAKDAGEFFEKAVWSVYNRKTAEGEPVDLDSLIAGAQEVTKTVMKGKEKLTTEVPDANLDAVNSQIEELNKTISRLEQVISGRQR